MCVCVCFFFVVVYAVKRVSLPILPLKPLKELLNALPRQRIPVPDPVPDPDLEIGDGGGGGGGGGAPRPLEKGGAGPKNFFFGPLGLSLV